MEGDGGGRGDKQQDGANGACKGGRALVLVITTMEGDGGGRGDKQQDGANGACKGVKSLLYSPDGTGKRT